MKILQSGVKTALAPYLRFHDNTCRFPEEPGIYRCHLIVHSGAVIFRHTRYDVDNGTWDTPTGIPQEECYFPGAGRDFVFVLRCHHGQPDHVIITNRSFLKPAVFTCTFEKISG